MQIHEVNGSTLRGALTAAREQWGTGAVVIDQQRSRSGVRLAVTAHVPRSLADLETLRSAARELFATTRPDQEQSAGAPPGQAPRRARPRRGDVERRLVATGVSPALTEAILAGVRERASKSGHAHPLDLAAEEIGQHFTVTRARRPQGTAVIALVGRSGEGKTTAALGIAAQMRRAGRRTVFAILDPRHLASPDRSTTEQTVRALGIACVRVRDSAELATRLELDPPDVCVLDTTGPLERDVDQLRRLGERLVVGDSGARLDVHVVLSATRSRASQEEVLATVRAVAPSGCILTKLDETSVPAPALEAVRENELSISFLCGGPDPLRNLRRAGSEPFADLLLRGRLV